MNEDRDGRAGQPLDVGMDLPWQWFNLTLRPEEDDGAVEDQLEERVERHPELVAARATLRRMLLDFAKDARQAGAVWACMRWEDDPGLGVVWATLLVHLLQRDPGSVDENLTGLRELLSPRLDIDQFDPRLSDVTLPLGRAVRVEAVRRGETGATVEGEEGEDEAETLLVLIVEYWVPVEGSGDLLKLAFASSNLRAAEVLSREFAGIAESFRLSDPARGGG